MRIAMLAPISWSVPPKGYGPWEKVVSDLTEGLVRRGVDVTLFATQNSGTSAKLCGICPRGYSEDDSLDPNVWTLLHIAGLFERAGEFDLIHNHFDFAPLTFSRLVRTPVVTTIHGFSSSAILPIYRRYNDVVHYVSISNADRHPDLSYAATVYHGIRMDDFELSPLRGSYLLFFGRIHPDKGCADAISVAAALGRPLTIAGIVHDEDYYADYVEPRLGKHARYIGVVEGAQRSAVLGRASALLHLIHFEEPFGLSVVEAMACGTPVVAFRRGSMAEIIQPGINGFLVDTLEEAVEAARACDQLDRRSVRASVLERFHVDRMVDDYIRLYEQVLRRS